MRWVMRVSKIWSASACVALFGCGQGATLDGSLTQEVDLAYERATLEVLPGSLSLRFLKARGDQWDTPLKVAVHLSDQPEVRAGTVLDLAEVLEGGIQRGSVTRNVYQDEHTTFPGIARGEFSLSKSPEKSKTAEGRFSVTFEQGSEFASGRAVFGSFAAEVVTR